jgi:hypothetical protein
MNDKKMSMLKREGTSVENVLAMIIHMRLHIAIESVTS